MTVERIVPDLRSTRLDESTAFYRDFLRFQVIMDHGWIATLATRRGRISNGA
jgi:catechol 2,3-dioxygenase-like lactoylglutathione lyase family enzyme